MDKKTIIALLVIAVFIVAGILLLGRSPEDPKPAEIAENWVRNQSPTYTYDGFDLAMESEEELRPGESYRYVFAFSSRAAGYGDRTDQMAAQVITPHRIAVVVEDGRVAEAISDGVYDELQGVLIEENDVIAGPETMEVDAYFVKFADGQEELVRTARIVPYTLAAGRTAINELLAGPLDSEAADGLTTAINEGTELVSLEIRDGTAYADFSARLGEGVAGSARVMAIRGQIERTLTQFPTVDSVIISINGESEEILQP